MSDLLSSLVVPFPQAAAGSPKESPSGANEAILPADSLVVHDVEAYLNNPKNKALMASTSKSPTSTMKNTTYPAPQPVQIGGPKTTYHISALNTLCQVRGLVPQFEIEAQAGGRFGGCLRVGTETVVSHETFLSKKEAKEALAEKGLDLVKGMVAQGKEISSPEEERKNWVGLLMGVLSISSPRAVTENFVEYHMAPGSETGGVGPNFIEFALGSCFACTCTIPGHDAEFGSSTTPFPAKKAARNEAAKQAVQFLIAQGLTNPDGTVKIRKKGSPGQVVKADGKALGVNMDATYAQKVNGMPLKHSQYFLVTSLDENKSFFRSITDMYK